MTCPPTPGDIADLPQAERMSVYRFLEHMQQAVAAWRHRPLRRPPPHSTHRRPRR